MKQFIENHKNPESEGLVVDLTERIFFYLGKVSVFEAIRNNKFIKEKVIKDMHNFVDLWVIGNLLSSILLSYLVINKFEKKTVLFISFAYSSLRIFEIVIYQINVNLFGVYRNKLKNKNYSVKSTTRTVILLLHNYIEIIFWYSIMIVTILKLSGYSVVEGYSFYIQSSFLCLTTFNHDLVTNISNTQYPLLSSIAVFEVVSGLVMTIISLANFIGKLPNEYNKKPMRVIVKNRSKY
jgi:hypothetical protein